MQYGQNGIVRHSSSSRRIQNMNIRRGQLSPSGKRLLYLAFAGISLGMQVEFVIAVYCSRQFTS